jgi:hypothetical protein
MNRVLSVTWTFDATECTMSLSAGKAAESSPDLVRTRPVARRAGDLLARRIWLPRLVYATLPWFYTGAGLCALLATVYISDWYWVVPHYLLFSAACVHMGVAVYRRRRRSDA